MPTRMYPKAWPSTGYCLSEWHEGTKPKDWKGSPVPVCIAWETCKCECHVVVTRMFEASGMPRLPLDNPEYVAPKRTWWMPSDEEKEIAVLASEGKIEIIESPAPDLVPPSIKREFGPTKSGRAARGELEAWVKGVCDTWLVDQPENLCTPDFISRSIEAEQGIKAPSVGAISAVFDRWTAYGFACVEKKPTRFVSYTETGIKYGLEQMKLMHKKKSKAGVR